MAAAIIELNDHELRIEKDAQIVARSPGCAIVRGTNIEVGETACKQAHLHPRDYHNRFWYRLDQASLRKSSRAARHHADLAFKHLEQLHKAAGTPPAVVFAIPGGFNDNQLALLLGIAEACKINTVALVDAAVASAADCVAPGTYRHIEMQLHRAVVTDLVVDDHVTRGAAEIIDGAGFDSLYGRFVAFIADQFLAQSRFDPLHQANTEQLLFNELPNWLQLLHARREIRVHIDYRRARFEAKLSRDDLVAVAEPTYRDIRDRLAAHDRCLIGSRLAALPGFSVSPGNEFVLAETAVFGGCAELAQRAAAPSGGLSLLNRLKAADAPSVGLPTEVRSQRRAQPGSTETATHLLCGARAYELVGPLYLTTDGGADQSRSTRSIANVRRNGTATLVSSENGARLRLNGMPIEADVTIVAGDELTVEGATVVYFPISVVAPDAP